jgi:large subunit ribosomal protein L4|tara:strand:+ start:1195 stop:1815 length:621 start_codon:yes stop_codon:yes gene_type:complete
MQLDVISLNGKDSIEPMKVSDEVFAVPYAEGLVHQVLTSYMNAARSGTKSNLGRSEVRGGGAKPWKQKGTGRARAGTRSSPIWRSGGVTFAAKPRSFENKVNKKMYRKAIACIISEHIRRGTLKVVDKLALDTHKTKDFLALMKTNVVSEGLFIDETLNENFYYASCNIINVWAIDFVSINPYDLLVAPSVVVTADVINKIEEWLS